VSLIVPVVGEPGVVGIGPAGGLAFNPATHTVCVSIGIGTSVGHNVAFGPITAATMWSGTSAFPSGVNKILSGWSASGGITGPVWLGPTWMISGAGAAAGPAVGVPGASVAATATVCVDLW